MYIHIHGYLCIYIHVYIYIYVLMYLHLSAGTCWAVENYPTFGVSEYGNVTGELAMMKDTFIIEPSWHGKHM